VKLLIEEWGQKSLTGNAVSLIEESIMCYKVGAYRSAYLMAYLAFKTTIRERVIKASKPDCIEDKCWDEQILRPLDNDNKWEETLNNIIAATKENGQGIGAVFRFTNYERIKNRYEYWKNVRNSCAHAKDEHITSSTVEQFWSYMQDDLPEFYVLGGKQYLLDKLCYDYKYIYTVGKDELVKTLKEIAVVYRRDIRKCFEQFYEKNRECMTEVINKIDFWDAIVKTDNESISEGFLDFLYLHKDVFVVWYQMFPQLFFLMINRHKEIIQEYLAPFLEEQNNIEGVVFWHLFVEILKVDAKLIDINKVASDYRKFILIKDIDLEDDEMALLHQHKLFKKFLFSAGNDFFKNDSGSHYWYYFESERDDEYVEQCFKYLEWDMEVIEKLKDSIDCLINSCSARSNQYSISNGNKRKNAYKKIIGQYENIIKNIIQENQKEVGVYAYIFEILNEGL